MSSQDHKAAAPARVRVFVLTVSDTRTNDTDTSGRAICELLERQGFDTNSPLDLSQFENVIRLVR